MDTPAAFQGVSRREELSLLSRLRETARVRVSAAAFSWLDVYLRSLVAEGASYQARHLPRSLRSRAQADLRGYRVDRFVRSRVSRLLDAPGMLADAEVSLALRPRVVARTEVNAALFFGRHELIWQLVERGQLRSDQISRVWVARLDRRTRDTHVGLHMQVRSWGTPFYSSAGYPLQHPHDPSAPASEVVNCRCSEIIRVSV